MSASTPYPPPTPPPPPPSPGRLPHRTVSATPPAPVRPATVLLWVKAGLWVLSAAVLVLLFRPGSRRWLDERTAQRRRAAA